MTVAFDPAEKFQGYAHPERLVSTAWLEAHLGTPGLVIVESDEDVLLYETGHIPGAVNRPTGANLVSGAGFKSAAELRAEFEALGVRDGVPVEYHDKLLSRAELEAAGLV